MRAKMFGPTARLLPPLGSFIARVATVAAVYGVARTVSLMLVARSFDRSIAFLPLELAGGLVVGVILGPTGRQLRGTYGERIVALTVVIFVSLVAAVIEGAAFAPGRQHVAVLAPVVLAQLGVALVSSVTIVRLFSVERSMGAHGLPSHGWTEWATRYLASTLTYAALYLVTGAISYTLVASLYNGSDASWVWLPPPPAMVRVALLEGALLPLAVMPLLSVLPPSGRTSAVLAGGVLFALGGVVALSTLPSLPLVLGIASVAEILFKRFPAGVVTALLLGPERAEAG